jgi:hypothetical protein
MPTSQNQQWTNSDIQWIASVLPSIPTNSLSGDQQRALAQACQVFQDQAAMNNLVQFYSSHSQGKSQTASASSTGSGSGGTYGGNTGGTASG